MSKIDQLNFEGGDMPTEFDLPEIPESEVEFDFVRASGSGGQNVNKRSTKAQLRWSVGKSITFTSDQKEILRQALKSHLNDQDEVTFSVSQERSQWQNRRLALIRLQELVREALMPKKERIETEVSERQRELRLDEKKRTSDKKRGRGRIKDY